MAGPWEKYQNRPIDTPPLAEPWTKYPPHTADPASPQNNDGDPVATAEQRFGLPPGLLNAVISKESSGNTGATSGKGAIGLTQIMPDTARGIGYDPDALKRDP